jgi:hypothetical protein
MHLTEETTPEDKATHEKLKPEFVATEKKKILESFAKVPDDDKINCFYAVPINHIIAWPLQSDNVTRTSGYKAEKFIFQPPTPAGATKVPDPVLLFYLVADVYVKRLISYVETTWMPLVDARPLRSLSIELIPVTTAATVPNDAHRVGGYAGVKGFVKYACAPPLSDRVIDSLAPMLAPDFPPAHYWSLDEAAQQMAIERHREKMEALGGTGEEE